MKEIYPPREVIIDDGKRPVNDRRRKKDWVSRAVPIISIIGWATAIFALFLLDRASPPMDNFFSRFFGVTLRTAWNASLLRTALVILILVFVVCVVGFLFNMTRMRRKSDKYNKSIITLGILALVGIVFFLIQFGGLL